MAITESITVNKAELAEALKVSLPTIDNYIRQGIPVHERGGLDKSYRFILEDCIAWYFERLRLIAPDQKLSQLRLRKLEAETELAETKAAEAMATIATQNEIALQWADSINQFKAHLSQIPERLVGRFSGQDSEVFIKSGVLIEIRRSLEGFALAD